MMKSRCGDDVLEISRCGDDADDVMRPMTTMSMSVGAFLFRERER